MKLIPSLFRVKIFKFEIFGHVRKELDKKAKGNFKTDNIYFKTNNLNAHIAQYLKKWRLPKYIESKMPTTCFHHMQSFIKKEKEVWNYSPYLIFSMIFEEKYFSCHIL